MNDAALCHEATQRYCYCLEPGSPKELMEKKGAYYNLYMAQFADVQ